MITKKFKFTFQLGDNTQPVEEIHSFEFDDDDNEDFINEYVDVQYLDRLPQIIKGNWEEITDEIEDDSSINYKLKVVE